MNKKKKKKKAHNKYLSKMEQHAEEAVSLRKKFIEKNDNDDNDDDLVYSESQLQTNNEALTSQVYDVSDITVRNNDLIFDFIVSNLNDRDVKYEIMVLLNNQLKENAFENEQAVKNMEIQKSNS